MAITPGMTDGGAEQTIDASASFVTLFDPTLPATDSTGGGTPEAIEITNTGLTNDAIVRSWSWATKSGTTRDRILKPGYTVVVRGYAAAVHRRKVGSISVQSTNGTTIIWGMV